MSPCTVYITIVSLCCRFMKGSALEFVKVSAKPLI